MTDEQIREFAKQSGAMFEHMTWVERDLFPVFKRFAELVNEHERESCAKLCQSLAPSQKEFDYRFFDGCMLCAETIRAEIGK